MGPAAMIYRTVRVQDVVRNYARSEQGHPASRALVGEDGRVLVNDLDRVVFRATGFQVLLCDECGVEGCEGGGWVTARRYGSALAWVPALDLMRGDPWCTENYAPPLAGGTLFTTSGAVQAVIELVSGHPALDDLAEVTAAEALAALQLDAPGRVLGCCPHPAQLETERVIAADPGSVEDAVAALQALTREGHRAVEPPSAHATPVTLYLDLPGTPAWTPIAREPEGECRLLPFGAWGVQSR